MLTLGAVIIFTLGLTVLEWWVLVFPVGKFTGLALLILFSGAKLWLTYTWLTITPQASTQRRVNVFVGFFLSLFLVMLAAAIGARFSTWPVYVNDGVLQTEAALEYLGKGESPYGTSYYGTSLETYHYPSELGPENPAFYHYVYLPGLLLMSWPVQQVSMMWPGFYDQRFVTFLVMVGLLGLCWHYVRGRREAAYLVPVVLAGAWCTPFFLLGYNDILPLGLVLAGLMALWQGGRWFVPGVLLVAFACVVMQTAWFAVPLILVAMWGMFRAGQLSKQQLVRALAAALVLSVVVVAPFWYWGGQGYWDDTLGYILGTVQHTYPAFGVGLAEILVRTGVLASRQAPFPFDVLQLLVGAVVGVLAAVKLVRAREIYPPTILYWWAGWLGSMWLVARYFALTHLGFILTLVGIGFVLQQVLPKQAKLNPAAD